MMTTSGLNSMVLKRRLRDAGLSDGAVRAAWPQWWSADADASPSAVSELSFSLARKLGLDARSLVAGEEPRFLWRDEARFKSLTGRNESEVSAMTSFGSALAGILARSMLETAREWTLSASALRMLLLKNFPFVGLRELLLVAWSAGIPVVHLRVFPCARKGMAAMVARGGERNAILLAKDSNYPASVAFYLAHEIGHIALGHMKSSRAWLDVEVRGRQVLSQEEGEADAFAIELLTGRRNLNVEANFKRFGGKQLAAAILPVAEREQIEPGTLALLTAFATGNWDSANASMQYIYTEKKPVWSEVNGVARDQLQLKLLSEDSRAYLLKVLGGQP